MKASKNGDVWTESYETLLKWVQELSDSIDSQVMKLIWPKFAEYKKNYALLKKFASDITKSAQVEWRKDRHKHLLSKYQHLKQYLNELVIHYQLQNNYLQKK